MWTRCPDAARLAAFVDQSLDQATYATVMAHVARCDRCLQTLAVAAKSRPDGELAAVPPALLARARAIGTRPTRAFISRWAPVGVAASFLLIAAVAMFQTFGGPGRVTPGSESGPPRQVRAAVESRLAPVVTAPARDAVVSRGAVRIAWSGVPEAVFYDVRIAADDGALVWEGRAAGEAVGLTANAAVQAGQRYYVTVTAHASDDRTIRSAAVAFTIARAQ